LFLSLSAAFSLLRFAPPAAKQLALCAAFILFAAIKTASAAEVERFYEYYPVSAASIAELQKAFSNSGPYLAQSGQRHAAATAIKFQNQLDLRQKGGLCAVAQANIRIIAKIYLPRWQEEEEINDPKLASFWNQIGQDISRHEAQHIEIAYTYALSMEHELRSLPARRKCARLQADAEAVMRRLIRNESAAQAKFDAGEAKRITQWLTERAAAAERDAEAEARRTQHTPKIMPPRPAEAESGAATGANSAAKAPPAAAPRQQ